MEILLPHIDVLLNFGEALRVEIEKAKNIISKLWKRICALYNVDSEKASLVPRIKAFYDVYSLTDINFIVGGARSTLPLNYNVLNPRLAVIEFTRPVILLNPYVYYVQSLIVKKQQCIIPVLVHEMSHIAFALGRTDDWSGLELELLYRASRNENLVHDLPCLWEYPLTMTLPQEWIKIEALFEASALWGEEILLRELGYDSNVIERRIKVCSAIEKEVGIIIQGEHSSKLIENMAKEHLELVKRHWNNVRGYSIEKLYTYIVEELEKIISKDFINEYINSVRMNKEKNTGCTLTYNPSKEVEVGMISQIDFYKWIELLNKYGKKTIVVEM